MPNVCRTFNGCPYIVTIGSFCSFSGLSRALVCCFSCSPIQSNCVKRWTQEKAKQPEKRSTFIWDINLLVCTKIKSSNENKSRTAVSTYIPLNAIQTTNESNTTQKMYSFMCGILCRFYYYIEWVVANFAACLHTLPYKLRTQSSVIGQWIFIVHFSNFAAYYRR